LHRCPAPPFVALSPPRSALAKRCGTIIPPSPKHKCAPTIGSRSKTGPCSSIGPPVASGPFLFEEASEPVDLDAPDAGRRIDSPTAILRRRVHLPGLPRAPRRRGGQALPMGYSTRPPPAASFAFLLALLFFSSAVSAGTTSRLACEDSRSHL
jgi:hypothetical protein